MRKPDGNKKEKPYNTDAAVREAKHLLSFVRQETARQRILKLVFDDPLMEFSLSELAQEGAISKSTASKLILQLNEQGLITLNQVRPRFWRIMGNYQNPAFKQEKILYNLSVIFRSTLVAYLDAVIGHPKAIILFGSFRRGEDTKGSDIDIAIEWGKKEQLQVFRMKELANFEASIGKAINIHLFHREIIDANLFNNIANGIVLAGFLEVRSWTPG